MISAAEAKQQTENVAQLELDILNATNYVERSWAILTKFERLIQSNITQELFTIRLPKHGVNLLKKDFTKSTIAELLFATEMTFKTLKSLGYKFIAEDEMTFTISWEK